ncbi:MAG: hypothetical protein ACM3N9_00200 [Syntrophothermus sp.]
MKKHIFLLLVIITGVVTSVMGQYPAAFNAPGGIFLVFDTAWHKAATVDIERSENGGPFIKISALTVPRDLGEMSAGVKKASVDFPVFPVPDDKIISAWWDNLNKPDPMPVFLMNPAGMIAAGVAFLDKEVSRGQRYNYRIAMSDASDRPVIQQSTSAVTFGSENYFPVPRKIKSDEDDRMIRLTWGYTPKKIPGLIRVFRMQEGEKAFSEIRFEGGFNNRGDSVRILVTDTTVTPMAAYKYFIHVFDWLGNSFPVSDTLQARAYSVYAAPMIRMFRSRPLPEQHAIRLSWPKPEGGELRGILLFRGASKDGKYLHLATLPATDTAYTDVVPYANENYWYFAIVANRYGYGLPSVRIFEMVTVSNAPAKPAMPYVSAGKKGNLVFWKYPGGMVKGYILYRGEGYRGELRQLSDFIPVTDSIGFLDTTVVKGNAYCYALRALGEGTGISETSDTVSIMVPSDGNIAVPGGLKYRLDGQMITLFWNNMLEMDGRVEGYNIYRRTEGEKDFKKVTAHSLPKLSNNFMDSLTVKGKKVEYAVASVDILGIESGRSNILEIEVPGTDRLPVEGLSLINDGGKVFIRWANIQDPDLVGYSVYRFTESSEPVLVGKAGAEEFSLTDAFPRRGGDILNSYFIRALYTDGTETEPGEIAGIRVR